MSVTTSQHSKNLKRGIVCCRATRTGGGQLRGHSSNSGVGQEGRCWRFCQKKDKLLSWHRKFQQHLAIADSKGEMREGEAGVRMRKAETRKRPADTSEGHSLKQEMLEWSHFSPGAE